MSANCLKTYAQTRVSAKPLYRSLGTFHQLQLSQGRDVAWRRSLRSTVRNRHLTLFRDFLTMVYRFLPRELLLFTLAQARRLVLTDMEQMASLTAAVAHGIFHAILFTSVPHTTTAEISVVELLRAMGVLPSGGRRHLMHDFSCCLLLDKLLGIIRGCLELSRQLFLVL